MLHDEKPSCHTVGEGLRKGLRDMQHHAARQTAGKRDVEVAGGQDGSPISHADMDHNSRRADTPQRDMASGTFLQSLKARYIIPSGLECSHFGVCSIRCYPYAN